MKTIDSSYFVQFNAKSRGKHLYPDGCVWGDFQKDKSNNKHQNSQNMQIINKTGFENSKDTGKKNLKVVLGEAMNYSFFHRVLIEEKFVFKSIFPQLIPNSPQL